MTALKDVDDTFVEIAEEAIQKAEQVECSLLEFYAGLRVMRAAINARLEAEASELLPRRATARVDAADDGDVW